MGTDREAIAALIEAEWRLLVAEKVSDSPHGHALRFADALIAGGVRLAEPCGWVVTYPVAVATEARTVGWTVRASVAAAILEARSAGRLQAWHEPAAAVALKVAAALGRPKLPIGDLVRLSGELQKLLTGLPLAPERPAKGAGDDGSAAPAGGAGEGRSHPVGLAAGVGSIPEVGDTALPG